MAYLTAREIKKLPAGSIIQVAWGGYRDFNNYHLVHRENGTFARFGLNERPILNVGTQHWETQVKLVRKGAADLETLDLLKKAAAPRAAAPPPKPKTKPAPKPKKIVPPAEPGKKPRKKPGPKPPPVKKVRPKRKRPNHRLKDFDFPPDTLFAPIRLEKNPLRLHMAHLVDTSYCWAKLDLKVAKPPQELEGETQICGQCLNKWKKVHGRDPKKT